jgi:hypothetical protein
MRKQKQEVNHNLPMFCELLWPTLLEDQAIEEKNPWRHKLTKP